MRRTVDTAGLDEIRSTEGYTIPGAATEEMATLAPLFQD